MSFASCRKCAVCTQALVGMQPDAQARAAELGLLLDAHDLRAQLGGADRCGVAARPTAQNCDVTSMGAIVAEALRHDDDLAELAARRERVVGVLGVGSSGNVPSTGTRDAPVASSGSTSSRRPRITSAFSSRERERSVEAWIRPRLPHQLAEVDLGPRAGAGADHGEPPASVASSSRFAARFAADELQDHVVRAARRRVGAERLAAPRGGAARCRSPERRAATPSCTAATPTPPAAPFTSSRSPGAQPAWVKSASWAVANASTKPPASGQSTPPGRAARGARARRRARRGRRPEAAPSPVAPAGRSRPRPRTRAPGRPAARRAAADSARRAAPDRRR